jgi:transposase-like protein
MTRHCPYVIKLSAADRAVLERRSRTYTARHTDVVRAKIVLLSADGQQNTAIAARLDVHVNVVSTWRKRFFEAGLDGLADRPRPGRPRSLPAEAVAEVTATGGGPPGQREGPPSRWCSTEPDLVALMVDAVPVDGPAAILRADRARGWQPARRSRRPSSTAPAPAGQLIAFESRDTATATIAALRHLVSSINRYIDEMEPEHARAGLGRARPRHTAARGRA